MLRRLLYPFDWLLSLAASTMRLGAGGRAPRPQGQGDPLILYDIENCPYCRIAREAVSEAGVLVDMRPCPKNGERFRPEVIRLGGKAMFPYLVDANTGVAMYESADIAAYVRKTYAPGAMPLMHRLGPLGLVFSIAVFWTRPMRGMFARPAAAPEHPLEFHAAEHSPGARIVREMLSTRELRYLWSSGSESDAAPLLIDPNTRQSRRGALAILTYLDETYPPAKPA